MVDQARQKTRRDTKAGAGEQDGGAKLLIPRVLSVKDLGDLMGVSPVEVIKELMKNGLMATINQTIDFDTAAIIAHDLGFEPEEIVQAEEEEVEPAAPRERIREEGPGLVPRPPVVTVMGHVDHGKTSLLDAIRKTDVVSGEAGAITQHIGAYQAHVNGQTITFLDTPGHEAFTAMRARGAQATDVAVLVVAADDGVMPQTIEAINHAKAAGVPIVVALNKIDLPGANPDRVKQELLEHSVVLEEWGGDVICVPVSAKTKQGLKELLENILVAAEVLDLKANPNRAGIGTIVEARLDNARGPIATILVETGTFHVGDAIVVGETWGRVKAMFNDTGKRIKSAGPGQPASMLGFQQAPRAGDRAFVVKDEKTARVTVIERIRAREAAELREQRRVTLDTLFGEISAGKIKELKIILKTDVQGSIEPIRSSLERLSTEQVKVKIIHSGSGTITEGDANLAIASGAIVIGFNTRLEPGAIRVKENEGLDIRVYEIIYNLVEDVDKALKGMLEPVFKDVITGHAEVLQVFSIRGVKVAGCQVRDGTIARSNLMRVLRGGEAIHDSKVEGLRRFKDDVKEVQSGFECGISVEGFSDYKEGDVLEAYRRERES